MSSNSQTLQLALYHQPLCPYCIMVRREMSNMGLDIQLRNISSNSTFRHELIKQGGKQQVPCLRIEHENNRVEWLYESRDIIHYLRQTTEQRNVEKA